MTDAPITCKNTTAPVTIVHTDTKCFNKCNLRFQFSSTGASASFVSGKQAISIQPNNNKTTPISFSSSPAGTGACAGGGGSKEYSVQQINIYSPSIHSYGAQNKRVEGEAIMLCLNSTGGRGLAISIPISLNGNLSGASSQISNVLNFMNSTTTGGTISGMTLNLNEWFKVGKPFYAYTGTSIPHIFTCGTGGCVDWIVYDPADACIALPTSTLSILKKLVKTPKISPVEKDPGIGYAFNSQGATMRGSGSDLVIDCAPVSSTGQTLLKTDIKYSLFGENGNNLGETAELAAIIFASFVIISMVGILITHIWTESFGVNRPQKAGSYLNKKKIKKI
jgi:hypothetical protein